jgi:multimeric flavodoxin WrbA
MLILGINGSPRKNGSISLLMGAALQQAAEMGCETNEIFVTGLMNRQRPPYCIHCQPECDGRCYRGTDLEKAFVELSQADGLILGSPVYFGTVAAPLKGFWDKTRKLRSERRLVNTVGGVITAGAARFGGQETTAKALFDMMLIQGMTIVGDGLQDRDCGHHGALAASPVEDDQRALDRAKILASRVVQVAEATRNLRSPEN